MKKRNSSSTESVNQSFNAGSFVLDVIGFGVEVGETGPIGFRAGERS